MNRKLLIAILGVILLLITGFALQDQFTQSSGQLIVNQGNDSGPKFVFDAEKSPDWASLGSFRYENSSDAKDSESIFGITVRQCKEGSNCNKLVDDCYVNNQCSTLQQLSEDGCFVHVNYFKQATDAGAMVAHKTKQLHDFGNVPQEVKVSTLIMSTPEGEKEYHLHQYDTNNNDRTYRRGSAHGFITLSDGSIEVHSNCREAGQLGDILPILSAIGLEM